MQSQRKVVCFLALILLVGLVSLSGCLWNPKPASTEPIVGIWVWTSSTTGTIYTDTFVSDGTYVATSSDSSISTKTGTWSKIQNNEYLVKRSDGGTYTWIYHPNTDTITQPEYPNVPSYRQRKQPVTTRPVTTVTTSASRIVLFSDDFSQWQNVWDKEYYDANAGSTVYSVGELHIRTLGSASAMYHALHSYYSNFILDVDMRLVDGTLNNWEGVNVRRQDTSASNYYAFSVSADGYYQISKFVNGESTSLVGPLKSSYINTGKGATNHMTVECNKDVLILKANGHQLGTVTDNTYSGGTISLKVASMDNNSFSEVAFDNLKITSI
jgi:hypothetical protein